MLLRIDLFIGFESLFNIDSELSFRLSIYLATIIGNNKEERIKLYDFFKNAYSFRSRIVHGADFRESKLLKKMKLSALFS